MDGEVFRSYIIEALGKVIFVVLKISPFCSMAGNSDKVGDAKVIGQKSVKLAKAGCLALLDIEILEKQNKRSEYYLQRTNVLI